MSSILRKLGMTALAVLLAPVWFFAVMLFVLAFIWDPRGDDEHPKK